ncbi:hypothetical protein GS421_03455 [Rhodococcus hoagii]|nr:hypothetical protein [Prescottella equi]
MNPAEPPLFCVHPLSGLAWSYAGLAGSTGGRPLYGLQATGEDGMPDGIGELAARYVDRVRAIQPQGPYHLLGWSLGGNIAHEMAVRLQDIGEDVASLTILDAMPATAVLDAGAPDTAPVTELPDGLEPGPPSECCAPARPSRRWRTATDPRIRRRCGRCSSPRGSPTGVLHWASCGSRSSGERWRSSWWTARTRT